MLIVLDLFLVLIFFLFLLGLHALYGFLLLDGISQNFKEVNNDHVFVHSLGQGILHPFVGLAAYVNKQITGGYSQNIIHRRLKTV